MLIRKEQTPEIWKAGGNIRVMKLLCCGVELEMVKILLSENGLRRESWIRHFEDGKQFKGDTEPNLSNVGGVVAQIKWGTIGTLGEQGMKD